MNGFASPKIALPGIFATKKVQADAVSTVTAPSTPTSDKISIPSSDSIRFVVPKLSVGRSIGSAGSYSGDELTPHEMSIKKIMDLKKLAISSPPTVNARADSNAQQNSISSRTDPEIAISNRFVVDLATALSSSANQIIRPEKPAAERFEYRFVDCDDRKAPKETTSAFLPSVNHACEIDIGHIVEKRLSNRSRRTTAFGKVLCSRFYCKSMPRIQHGFQPKHAIQPFSFDKAIKLSLKK